MAAGHVSDSFFDLIFQPQRVQGMLSRIEDKGYRRLPEKSMQRMTYSRQKRKATTSLQETMGKQPKMNFL